MSTPDTVLAGHGAHVRPLRHALALLAEGWQEFDALVRETAAPRRSVEELLAALGDDLERGGTAVRIRPAAAGRYAPPRVTGDLPPSHPDLLAELSRHIDEVPPPLPALDHVQATPETVLRRARWLDEQYDLRTARLVFVGDHDLTSLAVRALRPEAELTVLDVDDRVLEYLDRLSGRTIRTVYADLRFGLPLAVAGSADVVFSDPPYTPEGMALFAGHGVDCLADPPRGRLVLAYGYSSRHPSLGQQVQRELLALGLTFEAILPDFHRYRGAQAIGSAADLYVCQPTPRNRKKGRGKPRPAIYSHGPRSVESGQTPARLLDALTAHAAEGGRTVDLRGPDWTKPITPAEGTAVAMDLTGDPGPWLPRALLAVNAERVALLVPNAHPDLGNARAQAALTELVGDKYRLRLLRSTPDDHHAVVVADAVPAHEVPPAVHAVWSRAHGRLGNTVRAAGGGGSETHDIADHRLVDLPRHRLVELRHLLARS
ncbi:bis-aminopropyl spermidine synthase family protein [Qaidamihabitans albus]|uniref:bis-aminopropyl spermidine synthase family protein n=1 Tax=Qaidamihabitans albus TaxID=2795733 RepID=UPI0018F1D966|nr:bis-aminopropyl spermidine synthase family protein [Qaidamihabitans albus]